MSAARAVRIITEVAAVDRPFDYLVTDKTARVGVGDRVRVDFNGRSVRGWVVGARRGQRRPQAAGEVAGLRTAGVAAGALDLGRVSGGTAR